MANLYSIARPYALAAFEAAQEKRQLPDWKLFLETAAATARNKNVRSLLTNPLVDSSKLFQLFESVLDSLLDQHRKNFLKLLSQNHRLLALPEISDSYNNYYTAFEKISRVRVITAIDADNQFKQLLTDALTKRIQHQVTLECIVDPAILGGAIVHMGDRVIDGSIRGQLHRLLEFSLR